MKNKSFLSVLTRARVSLRCHFRTKETFIPLNKTFIPGGGGGKENFYSVFSTLNKLIFLPKKYLLKLLFLNVCFFIFEAMNETEKNDSLVTPPNTGADIEVKQSNTLVQARYDMSAAELNIFIMLLHEMKKTAYTGHYFKIDIAELQRYSGETVLKYAYVKKMAEKLLGRVARISDKARSLSINFISSVDIIAGKSFIELGVDEKILPYYKELDSFTLFQLNTALNIKGKYSKRLYMILSKWRSTGWYIVSVKELRDLLDIKPNSAGKEIYSTWQVFKQRVIEHAEQELKEISDLWFTWKVSKKSGREITHISFEIHTKGEAAGALPLNDKLYQQLIHKDVKLSDWQARLILSNVPEKEIVKTLYTVKLQISNHRIENPGAYAASAFGRAYGLTKLWKPGSDKKDLFNQDKK